MAPTSLDTGREGESQSFRLPRSHRLKRKRLIDPLFNREDQSTRSKASGSIRLLYRIVDRTETGSMVPIQVGFAVSRSLGGAVKRNRLKRIMREAFRQEIADVSRHLEARDHSLTVMAITRRIPDNDSSLFNDLHRAVLKMIDDVGNATPDVESQTEQ